VTFRGVGTSRRARLASPASWGIMERVQRGDGVSDNGLRGFPIPFQYEWLLALGAAGMLGLIGLTTIVIVRVDGRVFMFALGGVVVVTCLALAVLLIRISRGLRHAFVEVGQGRVRVVCSGVLDFQFPVSQIAQAGRVRWAARAGVGVRTNFRDLLGLVGNVRRAVELRLSQPAPAHIWPLLWLRQIRRVVLTPQDPDALLSAIQEECNACLMAEQDTVVPEASR
jgi:hypothetical protein